VRVTDVLNKELTFADYEMPSSEDTDINKQVYFVYLLFKPQNKTEYQLFN